MVESIVGHGTKFVALKVAQQAGKKLDDNFDYQNMRDVLIGFDRRVEERLDALIDGPVQTAHRHFRDAVTLTGLRNYKRRMKAINDGLQEAYRAFPLQNDLQKQLDVTKLLIDFEFLLTSEDEKGHSITSQMADAADIVGNHLEAFLKDNALLLSAFRSFFSRSKIKRKNRKLDRLHTVEQTLYLIEKYLGLDGSSWFVTNWIVSQFPDQSDAKIDTEKRDSKVKQDVLHVCAQHNMSNVLLVVLKTRSNTRLDYIDPVTHKTALEISLGMGHYKITAQLLQHYRNKDMLVGKTDTNLINHLLADDTHKDSEDGYFSENEHLPPLERHEEKSPNWRERLSHNCKVQLCDPFGRWYNATVENVDSEKHLVLLHYDGWPSTWDEWLPTHSERLRQIMHEKEIVHMEDLISKDTIFIEYDQSDDRFKEVVMLMKDSWLERRTADLVTVQRVIFIHNLSRLRRYSTHQQTLSHKYPLKISWQEKVNSNFKFYGQSCTCGLKSQIGGPDPCDDRRCGICAIAKNGASAMKIKRSRSLTGVSERRFRRILNLSDASSEAHNFAKSSSSNVEDSLHHMILCRVSLGECTKVSTNASWERSSNMDSVLITRQADAKRTKTSSECAVKSADAVCPLFVIAYSYFDELKNTEVLDSTVENFRTDEIQTRSRSFADVLERGK